MLASDLIHRRKKLSRTNSNIDVQKKTYFWYIYDTISTLEKSSYLLTDKIVLCECFQYMNVGIICAMIHAISIKYILFSIFFVY
jgi:hypothetical protein